MMDVENLTAEDIAAQQKLVPLGAPQPEGGGIRLRVQQESGASALLYVYDSEEPASRAAWCHAPDRGAQLFVVPELVESGPGWCLVQDRGGTPMQEVVRDDPAWLDSRDGHEAVVSIGRTLRKLHNGNPTSHFGDVLERGSHRWMTFNGFVAANLEDFSERVRIVGVSDATATRLLQVIGKARHELASFHPRSPSSLVHGRLAFQNVWLNSERRGIQALTGFESACALPAEIDLAWFMWIGGIAKSDTLTRALYRGYGAARTMDVQRRERFFKRLVALLALFGQAADAGHAVEDLATLAGA